MLFFICSTMDMKPFLVVIKLHLKRKLSINPNYYKQLLSVEHFPRTLLIKETANKKQDQQKCTVSSAFVAREGGPVMENYHLKTLPG